VHDDDNSLDLGDEGNDADKHRDGEVVNKEVVGEVWWTAFRFICLQRTHRTVYPTGGQIEHRVLVQIRNRHAV